MVEFMKPLSNLQFASSRDLTSIVMHWHVEFELARTSWLGLPSVSKNVFYVGYFLLRGLFSPILSATISLSYLDPTHLTPI
jgi:hypothetical protein